MTHAVTITRFYIPEWIAPTAHRTIRDLILKGGKGGDGEFDMPVGNALGKMLPTSTLVKWEYASVWTTNAFIVLGGLRIVFEV